WLHRTCGVCEFCARGEENLCVVAEFTGCTVEGGYAVALVVPEAFAVRLPSTLGDLEAAPLLCAGVIGYRALRRAEVQPGEPLALLGFGASAHLALQVLHHWGCEAVVMTRGEHHRELARDLGAGWVGDADGAPTRARHGSRARGRSCSPLRESSSPARWLRCVPGPRSRPRGST